MQVEAGTSSKDIHTSVGIGRIIGCVFKFYFKFYGYICIIISLFNYIHLTNQIFNCRINSGPMIKKKVRMSFGKIVSNLRRFKSVSDAKLMDLKTKWMKKHTLNKMQWGVRAFTEWGGG